MPVILSPSKTMDFEPASPTSIKSQPVFAREAAELIRHLKKLSVSELEDVMKISTKLAWLNQKRFALWKPEFTTANSSQAIFSFKGELYHGLDVQSMPLSGSLEKFIGPIKRDIIVRIMIERPNSGRIEQPPAIDDIIPTIEFRDPVNEQ